MDGGAAPICQLYFSPRFVMQLYKSLGSPYASTTGAVFKISRGNVKLAPSSALASGPKPGRSANAHWQTSHDACHRHPSHPTA